MEVSDAYLSLVQEDNDCEKFEKELQQSNTTPVEEIWGMIRRMESNKREWNYPILSDGEQVAISDIEKAQMMVETLSKVHSTQNLSEEEKRSRAETREVWSCSKRRKGTSFAVQKK